MLAGGWREGDERSTPLDACRLPLLLKGGAIVLPSPWKALLDPAASELLERHCRWMESQGYMASTIYSRGRAVVRLQAAGLDVLAARPSELTDWSIDLSPKEPESRASDISHVRSWFKWLVADGWLTANPAALLDRPRVGKGVPRPISEADLLTVLALAKPQPLAMLALAAFAGLRCAEIACLHRDDVAQDIENPSLLVNGKGNKQRVVPLSATPLRAMRAWWEMSPDPDGWVFPRMDGQPGHHEAYRISQLGARSMRAAGVDATMHQLRHRFATRLLIASNNNMLMTRDLLGHESIVTTQRYTAWHRPDAIAAVAAVGKPFRHLTVVDEEAS